MVMFSFVISEVPVYNFNKVMDFNLDPDHPQNQIDCFLPFAKILP